MDARNRTAIITPRDNQTLTLFKLLWNNKLNHRVEFRFGPELRVFIKIIRGYEVKMFSAQNTERPSLPTAYPPGEVFVLHSENHTSISRISERLIP